MTIESAGPLRIRHSFVTATARLVVDIEDLELDPALRALVAGECRPMTPTSPPSGWASMRRVWCAWWWTWKQPHPAAVVQPAIKWQLYRDRMNSDLYAPVPHPLETLIAERLRDSQPAQAARPPADLPLTPRSSHLWAQQTTNAAQPLV
ncbi:MAG: hypothetical protein IPF39_10785 [Comamonadaceae bacterium]|uniref:hypothetical protein n=1 Tax=Candidatus Skiveiella danica TaxID=3386177 RepID=UPI00390B24E3|nr:hypothetical protein [Comamonadaceae bacterium]